MGHTHRGNKALKERNKKKPTLNKEDLLARLKVMLHRYVTDSVFLEGHAQTLPREDTYLTEVIRRMNNIAEILQHHIKELETR
jgi:hypothetical protein